MFGIIWLACCAQGLMRLEVWPTYIKIQHITYLNFLHMGPVEMIFVTSKKISCDGGKSSSNHPLVYLNMGDKDSIVCPYCSKYFTTKKSSDKVSDLKELLHKNS